MKPNWRSYVFAMLLASGVGYGLYSLLPPFVFLPPEGWREVTSLLLAPLAIGLAVGLTYPEIWLRLCVLAVSIPIATDIVTIIIVVPIDLFFLGTWVSLVFVGGAIGRSIRKHTKKFQRT